MDKRLVVCRDEEPNGYTVFVANWSDPHTMGSLDTFMSRDDRTKAFRYRWPSAAMPDKVKHVINLTWDNSIGWWK